MSRYIIKRYIVGAKNKEKEIRKVMNHFARKERYMEHDLKRETMVVDSENEKVFFYPSKEDSFERLCENAVQFEGGKSAEDIVMERILMEDIKNAISKLPTTDKKILMMTVFYGINQKEIAKKIGINQSTVSRKLKKIGNMIKKIVKQ